MPPTATPKKQTNPKGLKRGRTSQTRLDETDDLEEWKKSKQLLKPKDQLEIPEGELKETLARVLLTNDPLQAQNLVEFSYAQGEFIPIPSRGNIVLVYEHQGTQIHKESEEAKQQCLEQGIELSLLDIQADVADVHSLAESQQVEEESLTSEQVEGASVGESTKEGDEDEDEEKKDEDVQSVMEGEGEGEGEAEAEAEGTMVSAAAKGGKPRKLTNQFNFCERAALTYNNPTRGQETQTTPPPLAVFSANVLQWVIYDAYQQDYEAQQLEKELERERKEKEKAPVGRPTGPQKKVAGKAQLSEAVQGRVAECWRVLERMVNQNTYDDIAKDYRYWEDPSDEFREEEGTLLPLWKFSYDKTKKCTVTDVYWNRYYYDLFAVCFGFLDFMKPINEGAVCLFTIKNPSFPDYICLTESAVICVDIHQKYPYMVVIGLYDGSVEVFNVQATTKEPVYRSKGVVNKHRGIVWEVKWAPNLPDGEMNFYSASADGKICNWVLMQNELAVTTMITLYLDRPMASGPDGTQFKVKAAASCIKFHPKKPLIYLVGVEMGIIYKCSTAYSSMYLMTYVAHHMPIYRIDFNTYNTDIFISCSADWRVKIWEDNRPEPLFVFDIGAAVGDCKFAPYSSTVFAAVTNEGKVYIFDLNVNKYKPICVQSVVAKKKNKLTRLSFNPKLPILIVGDDKGCVSTLKLSPNLRIPCKAPKKQQHLDQWTLQCMKLEKLLSLVREPPNLTLPEDTAGSEES